MSKFNYSGKDEGFAKRFAKGGLIDPNHFFFPYKEGTAADLKGREQQMEDEAAEPQDENELEREKPKAHDQAGSA